VDYSSFVIMLARQRSGTNPLRDVLASHPQIFCTPEVFHELPSPDAELEVETNFFNFLEEHPRGRDKRPLSFEAQEEIFLDFLSYLRCFSDRDYIFVDVKYNSTHHLDEPWREITAQPTLFRFIKKHELRVLNLTRQNYLRFYLSLAKANATGQWTQAGDRKAGDREPKLTLDIADLLFSLALCKSENDRIAQSFEDFAPLYLTFDYVDLAPEIGAPLSSDVLGMIEKWLGVSNDFTQTASHYRKQSVLPLRDAIQNYGAVERALRGTEFEYCLEDEPMYRKPESKRPKARSAAR
jgi:hypothetical protein